MTHGPPKGQGDLTSDGLSVGCEDLMAEIEERVKPLVHVFGHIHESYGWAESDTAIDTLFINAGILDATDHSDPFDKPISFNVNPPIVFDLPCRKGR